MARFERATLVLTLALAACHPSAAEGDRGTETETGPEACPELVWTGQTLFVTTAEEARDLPPYTRVEGSLNIQDIPGVTDLSFLDCLTEVQGSVGINGVDL